MMSHTHKTICALSSAQGSKPATAMSPRARACAEASHGPGRNQNSSASSWVMCLGFLGHGDFGDTQAIHWTCGCRQVESGRKQKAAWQLGN